MAVSRLASLWDIIIAAHRSQRRSLPTSMHPLLLHDPSGSGLNFSSLLVSLLLLISHHQVQSRRLGHLQCLEFQQLGSVPLSSDSDAETGHQPWAKGPHVVHHLIRSHSLHSSAPHPQRWAWVSICGNTCPFLNWTLFSHISHRHALGTPGSSPSHWEVHGSRALITFSISWLTKMCSTFFTCKPCPSLILNSNTTFSGKSSPFPPLSLL